MSQDVAGYAVNFFFTYYMMVPPEADIQHGFMECLYPLWNRTTLDTPLNPVVTAVASILLDAWSLVTPDLPDSISRASYFNGVVSLRKALAEEQTTTDTTIMAALMLIFYENLLSFLTGQRDRAPHVRGTIAMVESRRKGPAMDLTLQKMILGLRSQIITRALKDTESVSPVILTWPDITSDVPVLPGHLLDEIKIELADVQAAASTLTEIPEEDLASSLLHQAMEIEQQLTIWLNTLPHDWTPIRLSDSAIPQGVRDAGLYQSHCDIYRSLFVADEFNHYYATRLRLQLVKLTCLHHIAPASTAITITETEQMIQDLADTICATVPFHLGDRNSSDRIDITVEFPRVAGRALPQNHALVAGAFGGFYLGAQLPLLLSPRVQLRPGQKAWIGGQLGRIRRICNIA